MSQRLVKPSLLREPEATSNSPMGSFTKTKLIKTHSTAGMELEQQEGKNVTDCSPWASSAMTEV